MEAGHLNAFHSLMKGWLDRASPYIEKRGLLLVFLVLAYLITAKVGLSLFAVNTFAAPMWPASGLAVAVLFIFGRPMWPAVALGAVLINLSLGAPILAALAIGAGNTLEAVIALAIFRRSLHGNRPFYHLVDCGGLTLAGLIAPLVAATIGVGALWLQGKVLTDVLFTWYTWWSGDVVGILVFVPLILAWKESLGTTRVARTLESLVTYGFLVAFCYLIFWTPYFPYVYPLAVPLAWAAFRSGARGVTVGVVTIALMGTIATLSGHGAFAVPNLYAGIVYLQLAVGIAASLFLAMTAIIEERKVSLQGLEAQVDTLEGMLTKTRSDDRAKTEFIAALAHELRNPLAPIVSSLELMRLTIEKQDLLGIPRLLDVMDAHVGTVTKLLDDLLDVSRISHKKLKLELSTIELQSVINRSRETVEAFYESRNHVLSIDMPKEPIWLPADPLRLQQIIVNILYNAAKYTEPGGQVVLTARREKDEVVITVRDTGIGIPAFMLTKIFEPFVQIQESSAVGTGLGIGLFLTRRLVELHSGLITASSQGSGHGSEFTIRLPAPQNVQLPVYPSSIAVSMLTSDGNQERPHTILIVDDNEPAAKGLRELLEHRGHTVSAVASGPAALSWLKRHKADIVLLDIGLPEMTGYEVARRIRAGEGARPRLLIAITGYGQREDRLAAHKAGFDYHLTKPVTVKEIEAVIKKHFGGMVQKKPARTKTEV